jgi:hypothetical protein
MNKDEVLDALEDEREKFLDAIEGLSPEQMSEPGVVDTWSVKDIIHHLSLWEAEMVRLLYQVLEGEKPSTVHFKQSSVDATNAAWYALGKERTLEQVLGDFKAVRKQTLRRVEAFKDEDFEDPQRFSWAKDHPLFDWIGSDSFEHEAEHTEQIKAWRQRKGY